VRLGPSRALGRTDDVLNLVHQNIFHVSEIPSSSSSGRKNDNIQVELRTVVPEISVTTSTCSFLIFGSVVFLGDINMMFVMSEKTKTLCIVQLLSIELYTPYNCVLCLKKANSSRLNTIKHDQTRLFSKSATTSEGMHIHPPQESCSSEET
jgi:hypothetical protein